MLRIAHLEHLRQMALVARAAGRLRDADAIELALSQLGWPAIARPLDYDGPEEPAMPPPTAAELLTLFWSRHCGEFVWGCRVCDAPVRCLVYHSPFPPEDGLSV